MNIIFGSTPYQILIAIQMTLFSKKSYDLYILDHFHNAQQVRDSLNSLGIFRKVELVESLEFNGRFSSKLQFTSKIINYIKIFLCYLNYKSIVKYYYKFDEDTYYDNIFFSHQNVITKLAVKFIHSLNPKVKVHIFEDGVGGYLQRQNQISRKLKVFNKITGNQNIVDKYESIFLFEPSFYTDQTTIPIKKIPKIKKNNIEMKNILNATFSYNANDLISQKIIFFEQPYSNDDLCHRIRDVLNEVTNDKTELLVKLHPRTKYRDLYSEFPIYKNIQVPWEVISLNSSMDSKILLSYLSTACFTDKIIFGQEPYIIFLYKLKELNMSVETSEIVTPEVEIFVKNLINSYQNKDRIFIPNDVNELKYILSISSLNL